VLDVILDLRKGSPSFGEFASFVFDRPIAVYVPEGCAHGFLSLEDETNIMYCTGTVHNPGFDCGLRYDSFGFDWEVLYPEVSERGLLSQKFKDVESPFIFK
jgi:dTDP-4-dehydrorhamnose 3,5-epimerase/CDP-3, 6-dideoxy-D-glycero-D-glycero-4-hexulose-5-epimerase